MALLGLGSRSQTPNRFGSIQVPTSEYGVAVPIGWGSFKAPIKMLDYTDFSSVPVKQGGKGSPVSSYEYYAALDAMLVRGPIAGIGNLYDSGGASTLIGATETFTIPGGGGTHQVSNGGFGINAFYNDEGVTYQVAYAIAADDFGSDGSITLSGNQPAPFEKTTGAVGSLEYSVSEYGSYAFSGADAGKLVSITYSYTIADLSNIESGPGTNAPLSPVQQYNLSLITGSETQAPWGYMLTSHPERALGYAGIARLVGDSVDLGSTATTPSLSAEVLNGRLMAYGHGIADCDPAAIITDLLTDARAGCNWAFLGDLTNYSNFCVANNLFMSPFVDSVTKALQIVQDLCDLTNAAPVWSGPSLKIIPYGDTTAVGNGRAFMPPTQPVFFIDDDDCICGEGEEPVMLGWQDLADNYNRVQFEYTARNDNYNTALIHEQDEASILMNKLLPMKTITAHQYCVKLYAAIAMNMLLRRNAVPLRTYAFTLKWYYQLLEPMDIIVLDTEVANLGERAIRIVSVEEDENYNLKIEAEDFLYGVADGVQYPKGESGGNGPGASALPMATTLLAAFQPNARVTGGDIELWLALTGGANWGGCDVYLSLDGLTYSQIGTQYGSARAGTLTNSLGAVADPDTTSTADVTVTGSLSSVSSTDNDSFATLSLLGGELISYETASITGSAASMNSYALTTLHRGVFSSTVASHTSGEIFVRLDDSVFKYVVDPELVGKTIFLKFTSFNLYGKQEQLIANVTPYSVTIGSATAATNLTVASIIDPSATTTAIVQVFKTGSSSTTGGFVTLTNGATVAVAAQAYSGKALGTFYALNYNPTANALVLYTSASAWLADQHAGYIPIGSTTTPASGSGSTVALSPTTYSDLGASPTSNPTQAYAGPSLSATVTSSSSSVPPFGRGVAMTTKSTGLCLWLGFAGILSSAKTLSVTTSLTATVDGGSGTFVGTLSVSLNGGNTYSTLFSGSATSGPAIHTAAIPSGQDLSLIRVKGTSGCTASTATSDVNGANLDLSVSNINIA